MATRRTVLASIAAGTAALAGCTGAGPTDGGTTSTTSETATTTPDPTTETTTTRETTRDRNDDATKYDRVVVENRTSEEHRVRVAVDQDGETLHEGTYRAPIETGLRVEQQFDWGTHTVRASVDGGEERTRAWEHGSCASTPHSDGNMNLGVVLEDESGWSFVKNGCDYLKLGSVYVAEYEPASEHEVESTTTSTGTTTSTATTTTSSSG